MPCRHGNSTVTCPFCAESIDGYDVLLTFKTIDALFPIPEGDDADG
jgi:hypothetical protein